MGKSIEETLEWFGETYLQIAGSVDDVDLIEKLIYQTIHSIRQYYIELLPKEKQGIKFHSGRQNSELSGYSPIDNQKLGFNSCLAQIRERIGNVLA